MNDASQPPRHSYILSKGKCRQGFVIAILLILIGLYAYFIGRDAQERDYWVAALLWFMGIGAFAHALTMLRDKSPKLTIDEHGLWYYEWDLPVVPWDQVAVIFQKGVRLRGFLVIGLRDFDQFLADLPRDQRPTLKFGRLIKPGYLMIPQGAVDVTLPELQEAVTEARDFYRN